MPTEYLESIANSIGKNSPDYILTNCRIFDVHTGLIKEGKDGTLAIKGKRVVGLYDDYTPHANGITKIIDLEGRYVLPGFIEPHMHVESSMLTPTNLSRILLAHGTTTLVGDPHEIANVKGKKGIREMMQDAENSNLTYYFTVPSCVPALGGDFETNGAHFNLEDIKSLLYDRQIIGLGEVMNFPGVIGQDKEVLKKIDETYSAGKLKKNPIIIDGHCPFLNGKPLSAYINAGIMADHECSSGEELEERLSKGMFVMLREGSSAKNMEALLTYAIEKGIDTRRMMFCTDDKNPYELLTEGHLDSTLKKAMAIANSSNGRLRPLDVIRMATLNTSEFLGKKYHGRLGIGTRADIAVVDDLTDFKVYATFRHGKLVSREGKIVGDCEDYHYHGEMINTVKINKNFSADDFAINPNAKIKHVRVIGIEEGQLLTKEIIEKMEEKNGQLYSDTQKDNLKMAVIQRHTGESDYSKGFVNGFGIKSGAVATTIGHDSHNLGVIGTNDADMAYAVEELKRMQGGAVVVNNGKTLASLELRVGGIMSTEPAEKVVLQKKSVIDAYHEIGGQLKDPIIGLSFLQLPVIPTLKMTNKGLVKIADNTIKKVEVFAD